MQTILAANCDCNGKMDAILREEQGCELPIKTYGNMTSDILVARLAIIPLKPSGLPAQKSHAVPLFCPWCGIAYKTQEEIDKLREEMEGKTDSITTRLIGEETGEVNIDAPT